MVSTDTRTDDRRGVFGGSGNRMGDQNAAAVEARFRKPLGGNLRAVARHGYLLADLQMQLFLVELQKCWMRVRTAMILAAAMTLLLIASLPVLLLGLANYVAENSQLSMGESQMVVGFVALILAAGCLGWAAWRAATASAPLREAHKDFRQNMRWLRDTLQRDED